MKTETKHTQGPWKSHVAHELLNVVTDSVVSVDGLHVADVASYGASIATRNANARLIAAAPELLAALHGTTNCLARLMEKHDEQFRPWLDSLDRARAAIAKVEGRK